MSFWKHGSDCNERPLRSHSDMQKKKKKKTTHTKNKNCWHGYGEAGILMHCWRDCQVVQSLWKTVLQFLKKLNIGLPYGSEILLLDIYAKDLKPGTKTNTCT